MGKKGKYGLLSYVIEGQLIFYNSLNKNKKIIAISVIKIKNLNESILILNRFLKKHFINCFSIQISIDSNELILIINLKNKNKNEIIRHYNLLLDDFNKAELNIFIFREKELERRYLNIVSKEVGNNVNIKQHNNYLVIKNNKQLFRIHTFNLRVKTRNTENSLVPTLLKLISNLINKGFIIFNFYLNNNSQISVVGFIICYSYKKIPFMIKDKTNQFFESEFLVEIDLSLENIFKILWRIPISKNNSFLFKSYKNIFLFNENRMVREIRFDERLKAKLVENNIKYMEINQNIFLIKNKDLFLIVDKLDFKLIFQIIKKFYSKYFIYIFILTEKIYKALMKVEKINLLKQIRIISPNKIKKFKYEKVRFDLKNP
jgi:hypothetical protein